MLLRMIFLIALSFNIGFCAVWSSNEQSGIRQAYKELDETIKQLNERSKDKWDKDIKPLLEKIKAKNKEKETLLKEINALVKENAKNDKEILFLLQQEKQLLGNYNSILGTNPKEK